MKTRGFTLIELLVVISIIGMLSSVVLASISNVKAKARDVKRLSDLRQLVTVLELYKSKNGVYPNNTGTPCGWNVGNQTYVLLNGASGPLNGLIGEVRDPTQTGCSGIRYYRYPASYGCTRAFYVLGADYFETLTTSAHPSSPGWACPTRNWQSEFKWVTGNFE